MQSESTRHTVGVTRYDGSSKSLAEALELCRGLDGLKSTDKVLIKPNIYWGGTRAIPPFGRVTTSTMVESLLVALHEWGCTDITIGEGTVPNPELGSTTQRGYEWSGIGKVAGKHGARLVDFNSGPHEVIELEEVRARVSKWASECDFLIDLPVLKTHQQAVVSLGMKNLKGFLAPGSKKVFHSRGLQRLIALLALRIRPSLTIIDGIYGLEKGPTNLGIPHRMNVVIAGSDLLATDIVGARVMGIDPNEVGHLREYAAMAGRSTGMDEIEVKGVPIDAVAQRLEWRLSFEDVVRAAGITGISIQETGCRICSGCAAAGTALVAVLSKDLAGAAFDRLEVCAGREVRADPRSRSVYLLGDCAIAANRELAGAIRFKGCPPPIEDTVIAMVRLCLPAHRAAPIPSGQGCQADRDQARHL